ncbi:MAG: leucine-rich repeat domain-containing protein [Rikenellaceae bacterium]
MKSIFKIIEIKNGNKSLRYAVRCTYDKDIVIPTGVQIIPRECFRSFDNIKEIDIPEGVIMIGLDAFRGCCSLERITLPSTLLYIGMGAFEGCDSLEEITLPVSLLKYMGKQIKTSNVPGGCIGAFINCNGLKRVSLSSEFEPHIKLLTLPKDIEVNYI